MIQDDRRRVGQSGGDVLVEPVIPKRIPDGAPEITAAEHDGLALRRCMHVREVPEKVVMRQQLPSGGFLAERRESYDRRDRASDGFRATAPAVVRERHGAAEGRKRTAFDHLLK